MAFKNVLVVHGPNLNLLGERAGDERGLTLDALNHRLQSRAAQLGLEVKTFQSNHEGELVDRLQAERRWADAIIVSPDALAHSSYVLRETLVAVGKPAIEVHLSDIRRRESWRRKSVIKDVCEAQILGKGADGYLQALDRFASGDLSGRKKVKVPRVDAPAKVAKSSPPRADKAATPVATRAIARPEVVGRAEKSIGRAETAASTESRGRGVEPVARAEKSIGRGAEPAVRAEKSIGRSAGPAPSSARASAVDPAARAEKSLGRNSEVAGAVRPEKSLGRAAVAPPTRSTSRGNAAEFLTRALVRQKISERLSGKLTPGALAAWARAHWIGIQEGAPAESGHRDELEDSLQALTLSTMAASKLSDDQLIDLMAQLEG